ncbi:hypothetical protein M3484_06375 [Pseudomonas sp. GX19020]|uniref:hypothetical protein n=1 Tax=Pseudomonas sp. GX19020 TaxID=2942277 RepID=UPI0020186C78|nr:hypothetical protein [Pseudomonas sp. GX19020]MCL4066189.1 hypothetical protein [Pseudomonas sp. GX19020]
MVLAILLPSASQAEIARIRGGEHEEFTRIVIETSSLGHWKLGKEEGGYAFRAEDQPDGYDLSKAFDKIPKSRIRSLSQDKGSGALRIDIGCTCHAIAFEVRPGIIAIDVRNGPAPPGSEFERPFEAGDPAGGNQPSQDPAAPINAAPIIKPPKASLASGVEQKPTYNWLEIAGFGLPSEPSVSDEEASDDMRFLLAPLRDALLRQISLGIVEGVVVPGALTELPAPAKSPLAETPGVRIANGEMPGIRAGTDRSPGPNLTADGKPCLPDRMTDIGAWLPDQAPLAALSNLRTNLLTEFDQPVVENVLEAARVNIALGFGAEARQILTLLPVEEAAQQAALYDLSYLVDLEPGHRGAFSGMESCDSYAALWAILALATEGSERSATAPNTAAVTRSFSALSQDLRRHFAPALVSYFMAGGDETTARRLRDAVLRMPGPTGQQVRLMDAGIELATGNADAAADIAEEVLSDPGVSAAEAAILRAESAFRGDRLLPPDLAAQLAALTAELRGTDSYSRIRRAEVLTLAMTGNFRAAFDLLPEAPDTDGDLWDLASVAAPDEILLTEALKVSVPPRGKREVNRQVAQRLLRFGFAQEALHWLGPAGSLEAEADRVLAAEAALAIRDARLTVRILAGLGGAEADALRARAAIQLGNANAAAAIFLASGDKRRALRAEFWAGDWSYIADQDAAGLSPAAAILLSSPADGASEGILARGTRLAGESETARKAIIDLMQAVPAQFP